MPLTMNHDLIEWVSHEEKPGCQGYICCLHTENLVIYNHKNQMLDSSMGMYQIIRIYPPPQKSKCFKTCWWLFKLVLNTADTKLAGR